MYNRIKLWGSIFFISTSLTCSGCKMEDSKKNETVNIIALMRPKEGKAEDLYQALTALVKPTRAEDGCIRYTVYEEKNGSLFLYEIWRSQKDLEKHLKKSYIQNFIIKSTALVKGRNDAHFGKQFSKLKNPDHKPEPTIFIVSVKKPKREKAEDLYNALLAIEGQTKKEEGCIEYNLYNEVDGSIFMYEAWRSQEDLDKHLRTPYLEEYKKNAQDLIENEIVRFGKPVLIFEY
jgi:quinol monooxygenase YgiN